MCKTRKYLIATHGSFSKGIKSSLDIIIGEVGNIFLIEAYVKENKPIEEQIEGIVKDLEGDEELIIFSDLLGGSITNQAMRFVLNENVHIVSGFNLPLLIDVMLSEATTPVEDVIENAIFNAKNQIVYVNKLIDSNKVEHQDD